MAPPKRAVTPPPHLPPAALSTPTSNQTVLTRLLHTQTPTYHLPPPTTLTPSQAAFLTSGFPTLPPSLDPTSTPCTDPHNASRYSRKRAHIIAIVRTLLPVLFESSGHLLDACCGTAHLGLVLAYLLPGWSVTLLDRSPRALDIAEKRAKTAGLANVKVFKGNVEDFGESFQALVALHACGGASDACLAAIARNAAVGCVIPCCTGGSVAPRGRVTGLAYSAVVADPHPRGGHVEWEKARSERFRVMLGDAEFDELARCADGVEPLGKVAKSLLEHDRVLWMRECGRDCCMGKLGGGIKDDVIVVGGVRGWMVDRVASGMIDDFLGVDNGVTSVVQVLKEVVVKRGEVYQAGGGRVVRKAVHAAAEMLRLKHYSVGKGKDRVVVVKQGEMWSGEVFCYGSMGVRSPTIDQVAGRLCKFVPAEFVERRVGRRGDGFHVTIFSPKEIRALRDADALVREAEQVLRESTVKVVGVGRVESGVVRGWDGSVVQEGFGKQQQQQEAFYVILDWQAVQELRKRHGFPKKDVHITLGFRDEDVHDVRKDATTVVERVNESFVL